MKDIEVTLYDIFGYVFPGAVFTAALYLLYWTIFPTSQLDLAGISGTGWTFLLMVAYVAGHLVQALTNLAFKAQDGTFPAEVVSAAQKKARDLIKPSGTGDLAPKTIFEICDHYVMQEGETATRDVYVYRKGFYRGMSAALLLLALALVVRACVPGATIALFGAERQFTLPELLVLAAGAGLFGWAFYQRYRRFERYLNNYAVYSALAIRDKGKAKDE